MILDLGCGHGRIARYTGAVGLDIQLGELRRSGLRDRVCADAHRLPFRGGSISLAYAWDVLLYLHLPAVLAEIHRVLVPDGILVAMDLRPCPVWDLWRRLRNRPRAPLSLAAAALFDGIEIDLAPAWRRVYVGRKR